MEIGSTTAVGAELQAQAKTTGGEKVEQARGETSFARGAPEQNEDKIASEEILSKIKMLTEGGLYSVRFQTGDSVKDLIAQIIDRDTGEVVRQIPAEELIKLGDSLDDLRGLIIHTSR